MRSAASESGRRPRGQGLLLDPAASSSRPRAGRISRNQSRLQSGTETPPQPSQIFLDKGLAPLATERSCGPSKKRLSSRMAIRGLRGVPGLPRTRKLLDAAARIAWPPRNAMGLATTPRKPSIRPPPSAQTSDGSSGSYQGLSR